MEPENPFEKSEGKTKSFVKDSEELNQYKNIDGRSENKNHFEEDHTSLNEKLLNPFDESSTPEKGKNEPKSKKSLNPFDSESEEGESLNPFGDPDSGNELAKLQQRVTLNKTNSNDIRLNPFSDAYEEKNKKTPPPVPPPPRLKKKKKQAPTPPTKKNPATPTPDWEKKSYLEMEKLNQLNNYDKK